MEDRTTRVVIGLLAMVVLWVGVYWWWPIDPPVSFAVVAHQPSQHPISVNDMGNPAPSDLGGDNAMKPPLAGGMASGAGGGIGSMSGTVGETVSSPKPFRGDEVSEGSSGVIQPRFATHVVGKDETLETISLMYFGTRANSDAIARANPMLSPPDLKPGREILVPLNPNNVQGLAVGVDAKRGPKISPGIQQEYMVQAGDSLARISKRIYGGEQFANLIFEANRDKLSEPSKIRVGQRLRIPARPEDAAKPDETSGDAGQQSGQQSDQTAVKTGGGN